MRNCPQRTSIRTPLTICSASTVIAGESFERLISPDVSPSKGYVALTQILHQGWISTVLTTNFDECLQRAQIQHNRPHRLLSISTPPDYVRFHSSPHDPQLIYLHGSLKHYTDRNLTDEVQSLLLPQRPKERPNVVGERGRLFHRGEVAAVRHDCPTADVRVSALGQ